MPTGLKSGRHFTEAARDAAALARQRKREHKVRFPEEHEFVMVVVRAAGDPQSFAWQVRRFGHVDPVAESSASFKDPAEASRCGQAALEAIRRPSAVAAE